MVLSGFDNGTWRIVTIEEQDDDVEAMSTSWSLIFVGIDSYGLSEIFVFMGSQLLVSLGVFVGMGCEYSLSVIVRSNMDRPTATACALRDCCFLNGVDD